MSKFMAGLAARCSQLNVSSSIRRRTDVQRVDDQGVRIRHRAKERRERDREASPISPPLRSHRGSLPAVERHHREWARRAAGEPVEGHRQ